MPLAKKYFLEISERAKTNRAYKKFQQMGVVIAEILGDSAHAGVYIKLASQYDSDSLLQMAKDVAERKNVARKGAYFMKVFQKNKNKIRRVK